MTVAPNPVLIHRSRLPFRYPRRSLLRWYGPAANTSASSASANFNITSRTLPRNASLNRSGPKRPSIWLKHCILFPIGVFLLGLTLPMSQILFWDTDRIRRLYFPHQAGRRHRFCFLNLLLSCLLGEAPITKNLNLRQLLDLFFVLEPEAGHVFILLQY